MIQLVIAILIAVAGFGAGVRWHAGQDAIKDAAQFEAERERARLALRTADRAAQGYEKDKGAARVIFKPIYQEIERVVEKPLYRNVCLDDDGLRQLSAAIAGARAAASQPSGTVPRPERAD